MNGKRTSNEGGWQAFQPSKSMWLCSSIGVAVVTMFIGFGWGGWVTSGTAQQMVDEAAHKARARLIAGVCVERYVSSEGFAVRLAKLKEGSRWDREEQIEEGNWTKLPGIEDPVDEATDICVDELVGMKIPDKSASEPADGEPDKTG